MLIQLMAVVLGSVFSLLFVMALNLLPMKIAIINFGVAIAVASAKVSGGMVGKVEIAPLESE